MNWLLILSFLLTIAEIFSSIEERVKKYFNSDAFHDFTNLWKNHRIAYQNTLELALQQSVGRKDMNVFIKRAANPFLVSKGYYHTDNQVHLVLQEMNLDELPQIYDPRLSLMLPDNVIKLEAAVSKMIIVANYMLFRNISDIVYEVEDQNPYLTSPFLFEQVQTTGQLALIAEGCKISGIALTSLVGHSVHVGYNLFRLLNCQYSIEIFTPGIASPPVVASYLPNGEGLNLGNLLMKPISAELIPKLQAALFTNINTSAILDTKLPEIRQDQQKLFEETSNYVHNCVKNMNILTIKKNMGKLPIADFKIHWNDTYDDGAVDSTIHLHDMVLTGLETLYSTQTGGPFLLATEKFSEEVRFGTLQVRGSMDLQAGDRTKGMHEFAVEIVDVTIHVTVNMPATQNTNYTLRNNKPSRSVHLIEVVRWRAFHLSAPGMRKFIMGDALVTGYLRSQIPKYLTKYLTKYMNKVLKYAAQEADHEYNNAQSSSNSPQDGKQGNADNAISKLGNNFFFNNNKFGLG